MMKNTIALAGALVGVLAAPLAHAQWTPDRSLQLSVAAGSAERMPGQWWFPAAQWGLGWRPFHEFAVEAVAQGIFSIEDGGGDGRLAYHGFYGLRGIGYLPLTPGLDATASLGAGRAQLHPDGDVHTTFQRDDVMLGAGLMWNLRPSYSLGFEFQRLVRTSANTAMVRMEWHL